MRQSSNRLRWLKMLALPTGAKPGLALIMLLALSNALGLLVDGMIHEDKESIAATISILPVSLPEDFLLEPAQRLYFAQDFSFFVRGMLAASLQHA